MASTLRPPTDLEEELADYCSRVGAVKSRVVILVLREYLGDVEAPALPVARDHEPDELQATPA